MSIQIVISEYQYIQTTCYRFSLPLERSMGRPVEARLVEQQLVVRRTVPVVLVQVASAADAAQSRRWCRYL